MHIVAVAMQPHTFKKHASLQQCKGDGVMSKNKEPHQPHTLGATSSIEETVRGAQPAKFPCPACGKAFKTKSEMERHRDTAHYELKGHNE
jgi:predicted RNA-binding Zn-ribbon protein involved in translation (DUF1610 family)